MKTRLLIAIGLLYAGFSFGQDVPPFLIEELHITAPVYQSKNPFLGESQVSSIDDYLKQHLEFSSGTHGNYIGTEVISFTVTEQGNLTGFEVINSVSPEIDGSVIRILETTSGRWTPGLLNGIPTSMEKEVSLVFKPHASYDIVEKAKLYHQHGNKLLFLKENPRKALSYFNQAVKLLPYQESILAARSLCKYKLGDQSGAMEDFERILVLQSRTSANPPFEFTTEVLVQLRELAMLDQ